LSHKPLTDAAIRKYAAGRMRRRIRDVATPGLCLVIEPSGHKAFEMRFRTAERIGKMRLGPYDPSGKELKDEPKLVQTGVGAPPLTLAAARLLAQMVLRERKLGHDPLADHHARKYRQRLKIEARGVDTFAGSARAFIEDDQTRKKRGWRWTARLLGLHYGDDGGEPQIIKGGLCERWRDKAIAEIDANDIRVVITEAHRSAVPGLVARNAHRSEARARGLFVALSSLFHWLQDEQLVTANPCREVPRPKPAEVRDRVLSADEVRWFWQGAASLGGSVAAMLKLLLLTGQRLNEVGGMRYSELSDDGATWALPGERTKNGRGHVVPLPPAARALVAGVPKLDGVDYVFVSASGRTPLTGTTHVKQALDAGMLAAAKKEKRNAVIAPWRLHDLRRSCATGMAGIGIAPHVIEAVLNHVSGAKAGVAGIYKVYAYGAEKKAALERWAAHVEALTSGGKPAKVVPMRKRQ
jgi:integrase